MTPLTARLLADLVLLGHVVVVVFIVAGLLAIGCGGVAGWRWVRHRGLRLLHLVAIVFVSVQAWLGELCPLTVLEMRLRAAAGDATYSGGFIAHWLGELLYVDAPLWLLALAYSAFAALVILAWFLVPPRR